MAKLLTGTRIYGTGTVDTQLFVSGTNSATSTTTGALQVVGGVGIGGNLYVGGTIYGAVLGTATTATNADNVKTVLQTASASYHPVFVDSNNSTAAYEALYTTSSFVINPQSGNVSIGTANPSRKLDVEIQTANLTTGSVLNAHPIAEFINLSDGGSRGLEIGSPADSVIAPVYLKVVGTGNRFAIVNQSDSEQFTILTDGNVGIGFNAPNGKLDVAGDLYVGTTQNTARFKSDGTNTFVDAIPGAGAVVIRAGGSVEKLRVTANGGVSFGASGTAYGISGQILQSNGDAAPTWISTGSLAAANATTATHLSGGVAGQIPYQTAPGVTAFLSTGTAGDVLVSNGSSAATYNNTLRLAGSTNATSTTSGALQVVGGVGVGGDLFIQGDIRTNDSLFNLINANATTVNFAGAATALTMGASGSGTTNVRNNLTVSGNLTVQGTTTIVDSTVTNIADPILTLGGGTGNTAPTADDNKDRGIAFKWVNNGGTTSTGFFGYDDSTGFLTYIQTATITNEVVSGTKGAVDANLAGGSAMALVYQSSANNTGFLAAGTSGYILQTNGTGSSPSWVAATGLSAGSSANSDAIRTIAQTANASYFLTFVDSNNASNAYESVYTTGTFVINPATGNIGMGTASPQRPLHVVAIGTTNQGIAAFEANASGFVIQDNGSQNGNVELVGYKQTSSTYHSILIRGSGDGLLVQNGTGNVGLGNLTPIAKLHIGAEVEPNMSSQSLFVQGSKTGYAGFKGLPQGQLLIYDDTASTAGSGGAIGFGANTGASQRTWIASINSERDSATNDATNYAGSLVFYTRPAQATPEERVRITSTGNVGIGVINPTHPLHITQGVRIAAANSDLYAIDGTLSYYASTNAVYLNGAGPNGWLRLNASGTENDANSINIYGSVAPSIFFRTGNSERLRITAAGGIAFGGAANYGTSGQVLQSNGDAAPTWVSPSTLASASATNADNIRTVARTTAAAHYLTFVDSNNSANAYESLYTTSSFQINPSTGNIQIGMTGQDYQPSSGDNHTIRLNALNTSSIGFHDSGSTIGNLKFSGAYGFEIGAYDGLYGPHNTILHGNVGIGTQSPGAKLEVYVARTASTNVIALLLNDNVTGGQTNGVYKSIRSASNSGNSVSEIRFLETDGTNNNTGIAFATAATAGGLTERMRVGPSGNVGIGTTDPTAKFTINNAGSTSAAFYADIGNPSGATTLFEHTGASTPVPFRFKKSGFSGASPNYGLFYLHMNDGTVGNGSNLYFNLNNSSGAEIEYGGLGAIIRSNTAGSEQGDLAFYVISGGTGRTERLRITSAGALAVNGASNYGSSGQVLQSNGNAPPTWINQSSITSGGTSLTNTYVGFGSASNLLTGSSSLTWNGSTLAITGASSISGTITSTSTTPFSLQGNSNAGTYNQTVIYANQNNTSGNTANGIFIERGRLTDGATAEIRSFVIGSRGGEIQLILNKDGNLGIGTSTPSGKLHLYQTSGGSNILTLDTNFVNGNSFAINPFITGISNGGLSIRDVTNSRDRLVIQYSTGYIGINSNTNPSYLIDTAPLTGTTTDTDRMRWAPYNGPVGGTSGYGATAGGGTSLGTGIVWAPNYSGYTKRSAGILNIAEGNYFRSGLAFYTNNITDSSTDWTEAMRIGSNGNVSIGAGSNPGLQNKFDIYGSSGQLFSVSDSFTGTIFSANDVSGIPSIEVLDTGLVKFAQYGGQVGISTGTVVSGSALSVYGIISTIGTGGEIRASSEITAYYSSDARLKENIKLIENPITILDQIRGVTFDWTDEHMARRGGEDGYFVRKHDIGVIAQEVQAVLPELVGTREDGYLAVKYEKLVPLLIEAIKSQQKTIDTLTSEIKEIKEFLSSLKNN